MALRKTINLLPEIFRTDRNEKFLNATLDQLVTPDSKEKINGFVGRTFAPTYTSSDTYIGEPTTARQNYQLEPGIIYTSPNEVGASHASRVEFLTNYIDIINRIDHFGGNTSNHDRMFENEYYNWSSFFDFDKFVNFSQYYWLPNGPDSVQVFTSIVDTEADWDVTRVDNEFAYHIEAHNSVNNPTLRLARGGSYTFNVNQIGTPFWIQTEPGTDGLLNIQENISTREVLGVVNNGDDFGTITFNVPEADAQNEWLTMPRTADVDLATRHTYNSVQNQVFSTFIAANPDGFDGIKDIRVIDDSTVVFYNTDANESDLAWEQGGLFDADGVGFDNDTETFDPTTFIPLADRYDVYKIKIDRNSERRDRFNNMDDQDAELAYDGVFADLENKVVDANTSVDGVAGLSLIGKTFIFTQFSEDDEDWLASGAYDTGVIGFDTDAFGMDGAPGTFVTEADRWNIWTIGSIEVEGIDRYALTSNTALITEGTKVSITEGTLHTDDEYYKKNGFLFLVPTDFQPLEDGVMQFVKVLNIPQNEKVFVGRGTEFGNKELWKNAVEKLELVPVITAPLTRLYYADAADPTRFGLIDIVENGEVPALDIEDSIIGMKEYISPNHVELTNGLKVAFNSDVTPSEYGDREFFVEGVGESIVLVPVDEMVVPEPFTESEQEGFDSTEYDASGFAGSSNAPTTVDYFTINKAAADRNAWSRSNRWTHINVINLTSGYNNFNYILDQNQRANRPIIEFDAGLQLFNYGQIFKSVVTLIDTTQTDAFTNVAGTSGYFIDGVLIAEGMNVIWNADEDATVRNNIYAVTFIDPDGILTDQIHLTPIATAEVNDTILITNGLVQQGLMYHYSDGAWVLSQQKTKLNQAPWFDVFDVNGNSFGDNTNYFGTGFIGTKLFSYQESSVGAEDNVLGFPLSYKNFENVGDIIFENNYVRDKFTYSPSNIISTKSVNDGFVHKIASRNTPVIQNDWTKVAVPTRQFQLIEYTITDTLETTFEVGVFPKDEVGPVNLFVYKDSVLLRGDTTQNITNNVDTDYTTLSQDGKFYIILDDATVKDERIAIRVYADTPGTFGFYEIPKNLENNAQNIEFTTMTLGQIRNHVTEISHNISTFLGDAPGPNNYRDITGTNSFPGNILQHSAGMHIAAFLNSEENVNFKLNQKHVHNSNFIHAIEYNQKEYTKFKNKFLDALSTLDLDLSDTVGSTDTILNELKIGKSETFPFFYSDMIGYGEDNTATTYVIANSDIKTYDYGTVFDNTVINNRSVLVYLNDVQLYVDLDYVFDTDGAIITFNDLLPLSIGDTVRIVDYTNTDGSFIPPTPTKLGMYPKFKPEIFLDITYQTDTNVIQGHDGSIFVAFNDNRDNIILELEKRIYNNLKTEYITDTFNWALTQPGKFRTTDYSRTEIDEILSLDFLSWTVNNAVDYEQQLNYDITDKFTWNYSDFIDTIDGELLPGYWRGICRYYYDTDRPHTHPWEMLGHTEKPTWWETRYGGLPYTKGNTVMWEDLRDGKKYSDAVGTAFTIDTIYARPELLSIIPVGPNGALLPPLDTVVGAYSSTYTNKIYTFGDVGPGESAWRRSSEYPFAVQKAAALTTPASFYVTRFDTHNTVRNTDLNQIVKMDTIKRLGIEDYILHGTLDTTGAVNRISGISQVISDYAMHKNVHLDNIQETIAGLKLQLVYRVGGYTDKTLLKVLAEQVSPTSTNKGIFIPDDDYDIEITKSTPVDSISLSGVIITATNRGFAVAGYDLEKPYFDILPTQITNNNYAIHSGSASGVVYNDSELSVLRVPYNTVFTNTQQVVDFFVSYQRYLVLQGFVFDSQLSHNEASLTKDWIMAAKEFLFWSTQGWGLNSTITLNPVSDSVKFERFGTVVDSFVNSSSKYKILNQNFAPIRPNQLEVKRVDNTFEILAAPEAGPIYLIEINPVQYEHTIIFKNKTVFNDILYQPELGARQYRLKLTGFKTSSWDGTFQAPGYIYNTPVSDSWGPGKDYKKGDFVIFRKNTYVAVKDQDAVEIFDQSFWRRADNIKTGLLPNLANKSGAFKDFYNIDSVNLESETDKFGKGLIGYQKRDYLENLELDDVSQVKFFQGMMKQKGTGNVINKLTRAQLDNMSSDINYFEEWGFRTGEYGAIDVNQIIEVELDEQVFKSNPELIEFLDNGDTRPQHISYIEDDLYKTPNEYTKNVFSLRDASSGRKKDITTVGFPRLDDVDATLFDINDIQTLNSEILNVGSGYTIWVAMNQLSVWDVFRVNETFNIITSIQDKLDNEVIVRTSTHADVIVGDYIAIRNTTTAIDGFYKVLNLVSNVEFVIALEQEELEELDLAGILYTVGSVKFNEITDLARFTPNLGWRPLEKVWIESNSDNIWEVLKKNDPWIEGTTIDYDQAATSDNFGTNFSASDRNLWGVAGLPTSGTGKVIYYVESADGTFLQSTSFTPSNISLIDGFGSSVSAGGADYFVGGAPASNSGKGYAVVYRKTATAAASVFQVLSPASLPANANYGAMVAVSDDEKWIYVAATGNNTVYAYNLIEVSVADELVHTETGDGIKTSATLSHFPDSVDSIQIINTYGQVMVPTIDYTVSGNTVNFTFTLADTIDYVIRRKSLHREVGSFTPSDALATDNVGITMDVSEDGRQVILGAPNHDLGIVTDAGAAYAFERVVEKFQGDGATTAFTTASTIASVYDVNVNGVAQTLVTDFTKSTNTITFVTAPSLKAEVEIVSNAFIEVQKLSTTPGDNDLFGYSVGMDASANWVVAGVPGDDELKSNTGSALIYVNQAKRYGTITGSAVNPTLTATDTLRIDDYTVILSGTTVDSLVIDITTINIPGLTASNVGGQLVLTASSVVETNKLTVSPGTGTAFADLGLVMYTETQTIVHPNTYENENFGKAVSLDNTSQYLVVGSDKASTINPVRFDVTDEVEGTYFDSYSTKWFDRRQQSGAAYVFDLLPSNSETISNPASYLYIQQLQTPDANEFDQYGFTVAVRDGKIVVGAPFDDKTEAITESGLLYEFDNLSGESGWQSHRLEDTKVDVDLINKAFIYNKRRNEILEYFDWIDPFKGKIAGIAQQELSFMVERDPAIYNVNTNLENAMSENIHWSEDRVGKLWWDLSTVRYIEYEQGDLDYRTSQWGAKFPGSEIDIYEWVQSSTVPSAYSGEGTPKFTDDSSYVSVIAYNPVTDTTNIMYYFWVKDLITTPNIPERSLSSTVVANYIDNPKSQGLHYLGVIDSNAVIIHNATTLTEDKNVLLHVNYDVLENANVLHSEYQLVAEGDEQSIIDDKIYTKFVDSLSGANVLGDSVPQVGLSVAERYGVLYRPRQTLFVDRTQAVKIFVDFCNSVFSQYQIANQFDLTKLSSAEAPPGDKSGEWDDQVQTYAELTYLDPAILATGYNVLVDVDETTDNLWTIYSKKVDNTWTLTKVQAYDTSRYWDRTTWYADGFTTNTVVNFAVETEPDLDTIVGNLVVGDLVKVKFNDQGASSIVEFQADGSFAEVVVDLGTVKLKSSLYDITVEATGFDNSAFDNGRYDQAPVIEIRKIAEAVKEDIFVEDLRVEFNNMWFTMIEYLLTEQPYADWLFKTSFIKVIQTLRGLDQFPNFQRDNQDYIKDYIEEVKPYRTNIREYILQYTKDDPWGGDVSDFDVHSYYDTNLGYYRKPSGELSSDSVLWEQGLNIPWGNEYKYTLGSIAIIDSGSGFIEPPIITISGGGGTGATATAKTNGDIILSITVTNAGTGFTSTPTLTIDGTGTGLELYPQLTNGKVREFSQTLKFDRYTYSSDIVTWTASTAYTEDDIITYLGEAYQANADFTSGTTFDATNLDVYADEDFANAADRIAAYYQPTSGMIGNDLSQLQSGTALEIPKLLGPDYTANPGFDVAAFDVEPLDASETDEDGIVVISGASALDTIVLSDYTDAALGTAPEDINVTGGAFVDVFNSHSPEELVPGIVFDTLDMKVFSITNQDNEYDGNGFRIYTHYHNGDGAETVFSFRDAGISRQEIDNLLVWTKLLGVQYTTTDFTVDYIAGTMTMAVAPGATDILYIYTFGVAGEKPVLEQTTTADGVDAVFTFNIDSTQVTQAYALVDGVDIVATVAANGSNQVDVTLASTPTVGQHVHVVLYNLDVSRTAETVIQEELFTYTASRDFTVEKTIQYSQPFGANIVVEVDGIRLRPSNAVYYTGDAVTDTFTVPTSAGETQALIANADITVTKFALAESAVLAPTTNMANGVDFTIAPFTGPDRSITFTSVPETGDKIIIGISTDAEYTVNSAGTIVTIDAGVALSGGETIRIISTSNHNPERIQTNVFKGTGDSSPGQRFTLDRPVTNTDYLWITVDGVKLHSAEDYAVTGSQFIIGNNIVLTASSIIAVTGFTENIMQPATGFRIFKDMLDDYNYYRIAADNITTLTQDLDIADETIYVADASVLPQPNIPTGNPGKVIINGELITYWARDTTLNTLTSLRRAVSGTGARVTHVSGSNVEDFNGQVIPGNTHTNTWYDLGSGAASTGLGLQNADTIQANYIKEKNTLLPS